MDFDDLKAKSGYKDHYVATCNTMHCRLRNTTIYEYIEYESKDEKEEEAKDERCVRLEQTRKQKANDPPSVER